MSNYSDEKENKNFVSGWKYFDDLPSICDCGMQKTLPQKSKAEGTRVNVSYYKVLLALLSILDIIATEKQILLESYISILVIIHPLSISTPTLQCTFNC